jgi:hypothetical protein
MHPHQISRTTPSHKTSVENALERHGVSFVSVTQAFNTTTSMGRLTLNILLSFAQFEREVSAERTRDKVAASRKKGLWMGGTPPLGYDVVHRKLVVNETEAKLVQMIFRRFLRIGSATKLAQELRRAGHTTKAWTTQNGHHRRGKPIDKGALYRILDNRVYLGEAVHKGTPYPGEGASLVERVHAIQKAGMEVWSGMIVGFDHDEIGIFEAQRQFLKEARIANAMIGMLTAIPKTPLHARLAKVGRLDPADPPSCGTNVIPLRMSREDLRDGYVKLMADVYTADSYFERLDRLYLDERLVSTQGRAPYWRCHSWRRLQVNASFVAEAVAAYLRLMHGIPEAELRREYRKRLWRVLRTRREPSVLRTYAIRCAMHYTDGR